MCVPILDKVSLLTNGTTKRQRDRCEAGRRSGSQLYASVAGDHDYVPYFIVKLKGEPAVPSDPRDEGVGERQGQGEGGRGGTLGGCGECGWILRAVGVPNGPKAGRGREDSK